MAFWDILRTCPQTQQQTQCLKACLGCRFQIFDECVLLLLRTGFELMLRWDFTDFTRNTVLSKLLVDHKTDVSNPTYWAGLSQLGTKDASVIMLSKWHLSEPFEGRGFSSQDQNITWNSKNTARHGCHAKQRVMTRQPTLPYHTRLKEGWTRRYS